jgi:tetratricopeptide (TPR) repeat protein
MTKHIILFLAANPQGANRSGLDPQARRVALDQEASAIQKELKRSGYRDRFELVTRWAAEPHDLLRELRALKPTVVHFSGHGGQEGLFFQAPNGDARVVAPAAIAETFGVAGGSVKLVVLSACYSTEPAEALLAHVDCIVGISGALSDDMARAFAIGFYGALGEQESVAAAYRHGNAAISLEGLAEADRPQLRVRAGADAARIVLAAVAPVVHVALPCPYPGMRPYSADDADYFHGRGAEIDELIDRLRAGEREVYIIGPSGSGKSSLVAAGVLPRLARGVAGLGPCVVRTMRPGEHPAAQLHELLDASDLKLAPEDAIAALLGGRAFGSSVLILIDQLEELFTLADAGERERFLRALAALRAVSRCVVVFTLRADFFGAFMESPLWTDRHGRISRIEVSPLRGKALSEAIVHPARDLGVSLEPELIGQLLADAGSEPGILPLLQETLVQLWDRRQGQTLTLADYQALGDRGRSGLVVALSRRADAALRELTPAQEAIARRILLRLSSFGEGRSDTRRQQPRSKLRAADDDAADFELVLRRLIGARLLIADEDDHGGEARIDLAHEVMIAAWPTLAGWIQTHRAAEQRRRQLEAAALQWVEHGRGVRGLLDPSELADAEAWRTTESARELGGSIEVAELVAASKAAHNKQKRRRRSFIWSAVAALMVFVSVVVALAAMASHEAKQRQDLVTRSDQEAQHAMALAEVHLRGGYPSEALYSLDRCISEARVASVREVEGHCHLAAARVLAHVGYFDGARRELDVAEPLLSTDRDLATLWFEHGNFLQEQSRGKDRVSRPASAIAAFQRALGFATRARARDLVFAIELNLAQSFAELGRIEEAELHYATATALDRDKSYESNLAKLAAQIAYRRGDLDRASSVNTSLYAKMLRGDDRFEVCVMQARIALALNDLEAAERWAQRGIDEVEQIQASQTAVELRPWVLASRRAPYELRFVALARANRFEEAVRVFDRWQGRTLLDAMARPSPNPPPRLATMAKNIESLAMLLPAASSVPLMSTGDRGIVEALRSIDLLVLAVAEDNVWRVISRGGQLKIEKLGTYDSLEVLLDNFQRLTDRAQADAAGERLIPAEMFRDPSTLYVVLDAQLAHLPVSALRGGGKPLVAVRPVVHLPRLPSKDDATCAAPGAAVGATVLADADGNLPSARREAEMIAGLLKTTAHVGEAATSAALFAAKSDAVLHVGVQADFGTYGGVLRLHDRPVSALEISAKRLGPSLVTLAGCSTAHSADPELAGSLSTAFLASGSSHVIATLRRVTDQGSAEVMLRFYEGGGIADPVRTLARVQAELSERGGNKDWPNFAVFGKKVCASPTR